MEFLSTLRTEYSAHARGRAQTPGHSDARTPGRRDARFSPKFEIFVEIRDFRRNSRFSPKFEIFAETQEFRNDPPNFRRDDLFFFINFCGRHRGRGPMAAAPGAPAAAAAAKISRIWAGNRPETSEKHLKVQKRSKTSENVRKRLKNV